MPENNHFSADIDGKKGGRTSVKVSRDEVNKLLANAYVFMEEARGLCAWNSISSEACFRLGWVKHFYEARKRSLVPSKLGRVAVHRANLIWLNGNEIFPIAFVNIYLSLGRLEESSRVPIECLLKYVISFFEIGRGAT